MSERPIKTRLLALARKTLDESSTEPERVTSGNMLAREVIRLLESGNLDSKLESDAAVDEILRQAKETVERAVATAVQRATTTFDPESPPTWVEFDPPPPVRDGPSFGGEFGKPPRRRSR